jgi:hypothetical protein
MGTLRIESTGLKTKRRLKQRRVTAGRGYEVEGRLTILAERISLKN